MPTLTQLFFSGKATARSYAKEAKELYDNYGVTSPTYDNLLQNLTIKKYNDKVINSSFHKDSESDIVKIN